MGVHILNKKKSGTWWLENDLYNPRPMDVNGQITIRTQFYREFLMRKALTIFEITGEPENFDSDWFMRHLLYYGWVAVAETKKFGIIPVEGAYSNYNVYGYPTDFETANALIQPPEKMTFGKNAVLIWLTNIAMPNGGYTFRGINNLINIYAEQLASIDCGIDVNIINSKVAFVFTCETEAQAKTIQRMYSEISNGTPAVFRRESNVMNLNSDGTVAMLNNNVKNTFIVPELQDAKRSIMNEYLTAIGINNAPVNKRERVQNAETYSNDYEIYNAVEDWYRNIKRGFDKCNKIFGLNMQIRRTSDKFREKREEAQENETVHVGRPTGN